VTNSARLRDVPSPSRLENLYIDAGLIVDLRCENFAFAGGNDGVSLDHGGHYTACDYVTTASLHKLQPRGARLWFRCPWIEA
jgi:hypothetical protein